MEHGTQLNEAETKMLLNLRHECASSSKIFKIIGKGRNVVKILLNNTEARQGAKNDRKVRVILKVASKMLRRHHVKLHKKQEYLLR